MWMKTCEEVRRENLEKLWHKYGGQTGLNHALERLPKDQTISQIIKRSPDSRSGTPRSLGAAQARAIESKLGLPNAYLDQDQSLAPWPFSTFTQEEYKTLSDSDQAIIENWIADRIAQIAPPTFDKKILPAAKVANSR
jgi:hypothetical protein